MQFAAWGRATLIRMLGALGLRRADQSITEELESHLQLETEEGMRAGMTEREARRQALLRHGGLAQAQQSYREREILPWLADLGQDIRYGLRMLSKSPGFTIVAVLTLALGIGANTALFSVVNGVLLHPLPFPHAEELLAVHASKANFSEGSISYPNFRDWQRNNKTLAALAVSRGTGYVLSGLGPAEEVRAELVSSDFFSLLGVKPVIGRTFQAGEDEIGSAPLAMISTSFWANKLGSRPDVAGRPLTLDGRDYTIVGVLPSSFNLTINNFRAADIYVPIGQFQNPVIKERAYGLGIHGIARLKPGITLAQAQADMRAVSRQLEIAYPAEDKGIEAKLVPFQESMVRDVRPMLLVLMAAVGFVLLIACVNVANLLLARSSAREQEFAVRSALGAGRLRLVRQLLVESLLLSAMGGAVALLLAVLGTQAMVRMIPLALPRSSEIHLDLHVLSFTFVVTLAAGLLFGFAPARKLYGQNLQGVLKAGGRAMTGGSHRMQDWLVIFQMASALVLLIGAGLMIRSLVNLSNVDPGFQPKGVLNFGLEGTGSKSAISPEASRAYLREAEQRVSEAPDVRAASLSWGAFPMMGDDESQFWLAGEAKPSNENAMHTAIRYIVGPGYLNAMGIPLLKGRFLQSSDDEHGPRVIVIDDVFARKFFGAADPIGKRIHLNNFTDLATVVGVVGHVNQWGLDNDAVSPLRAETYESLMQLPEDQLAQVVMGMDVVVRSKSGSVPGFKAIENSVTQAGHEQVVYNPNPMEQVIADSLASRRFSMILLIVFAATALAMASLGMYGVISYLVGQRSREIGIRIALGADRKEVLRWVMVRGTRLAVIGAGAGIAGALLLTQWMSRSAILFEVKPYDPWTLGGVTALMLAAALLACFLPALRATRIDPMAALRAE